MVEGAFSGVYSGSFSTPEIVDVSSSPRSGRLRVRRRARPRSHSGRGSSVAAMGGF